MTRRPALDRDLVRGAVVVAVGLVVVSIYALPGYMTRDSFEQLAQARSGELSDWHPPLMSAIWGLLDRVIAGPLLMLVLQCTMFLAGLYVLLRRRLAPLRAAVITVVIFAFPPCLSQMAVILKDGLMCGALLVGCAGLTSERRGPRIAGLVAFGLAVGLRYNAIAMVLPLVALLCPWPAQRPRWIRIGAGALIAFGLTGAAWGCNRILTDVQTHPFHYSVAPMDIVGTLAFAEPMTDAEIRELFVGVRFAPPSGLQAYAQANYDPARHWGYYIAGPTRFFDEPTTPELRSAIAAGWWRMVRAEPGAYLTSRLDTLRELLGLSTHRRARVYEANYEAHLLDSTGQPMQPRNGVQQSMSTAMRWLGKRSLMFRAYVYLVLAIGLLVRLRRDRLVLALVISTLTNLALLFIMSPAIDFRYVLWLVVAVLIGVAIQMFGARPQPDVAR